MVDMKVLGLTMDSGTKAPILVLRTLQGEDVLPLWIGGVEAMSISLALSNTQAERPLTHDLLISLIQGMNASVTAVNIIDVEGGIFYATLDIVHGSQLLSIDCRPSDGIALALRVHAPIRASKAVIAKAPVDRYKKALEGKIPEPDETGDIVMRSLKQVQSLLSSNQLGGKERVGEAEEESRGDASIEEKISLTPDESESEEFSSVTDTPAFSRLSQSEEDELLSQMLRDLEPASKHRM